jgi:hypothetical protein
LFFFGAGKPGVGIESPGLIEARGFYFSISVHPARAIKNTGIRVTINRVHSEEEIIKL